MSNLINIIRAIIVLCLLIITTATSAILICLSWVIVRLFYFGKKKVIRNIPSLGAFAWATANGQLLKWFLPTQWVIDIPTDLDPERWYLLIANHRSWTDILVLYTVFHRNAAMIKFFLKRELLWRLPLAGLACYVLNFPFLVRHSKKHLRKKPELKWKDIETTKKACDNFKLSPCIIINFLEGTRFTAEKHDRQNSPYHYLLKPKVAGIALVLQSMESYLAGILDVTIKYSTATPTFWNLILGKIKTITVTVQNRPISKQMIGDYYKNRAFRKELQQHFNQLWVKKDQQLIKLNEKRDIEDE